MGAFLQLDLTTEVINWANKNILDRRDKLRVKFNEYEEKETFYSKIKFSKNKSKATIILSHNLPYNQIPGHILAEVTKYLMYKDNGCKPVSRELLLGPEWDAKFGKIVDNWNDYIYNKLNN
jgi:hypothetical protein